MKIKIFGVTISALALLTSVLLLAAPEPASAVGTCTRNSAGNCTTTNCFGGKWHCSLDFCNCIDREETVPNP